MEELNVNIGDYISEERIKEIVEEEFRSAVRRHFYKESETARILSNVSYEIALKAVIEATGKAKEEIEEILTKRVKEVLEDGKEVRFEIFRSSEYGDAEGPARPILRKVVAESEGLIREVVEKNIREYDFAAVKDGIRDMVYEVIEERLFGGEE